MLRAGLESMGVPAGEARQEAMRAYLRLLERWNRTYNLTAVREPADMVSRHLLDSLSVLPWCTEGRLLDAGAGAGLPGIPLAIANPALDVTLVDSVGKKVRFMNHVKRELGLQNIQPVQARLEVFASDRPFDAIISRAFSSLAAFATAARHLAGNGTRLLAMKGRRPDEEIGELPAWVRVCSVEELDVPGLHEKRHLVIMTVNP
ncbi:MAG: 16S rRNA (guanine(527)-N(7))-methyltransferase RsmG [Xanthomonadales bacterium]|jgi:16S rRNA (guanine527-N7)-methyltransferase|nr:16S rRNA (guanine(527)-N(7))-methyltransferase RsmG [Xanthomonadales bacterium]